MKRKLKIVAVGDPFLEAETLDEVIRPGLPPGVGFEAVAWTVGGKEPLQRINLQVETSGPEGVPPPPAVLARLGDADVLFTQFFPVSSRVLAAAPRLRVIGVGRSGVENVNLPAATARGIAVLNTTGRNAEAVAEYAIGLLLAEARNIGRAHAALKQGVWRKKYPNDESVPELAGKTLGLVGFGQIGRLMVRRLSGFEMTVLACDPYAPPQAGVEFVDLPTLLRRSDFVSLHAKVTPETRGLIGRAQLALMKRTACLINTARAELIDEAALVETLREGRIAGAAIDVFAREPPAADDPLLALDNVTFSPHQAGVTVDAYRTTARLFLENISRLWQGDQPPGNLVNRETAAALAALKRELV